MPGRGIRVYGGIAALPVQIRFCADVLRKRFLQRQRYPLLELSAARGGFLETLRLMARLRMTRVIRASRGYHFSLLEPRWPSPAYDNMIARGGLSLAAAGTPRKAQIDLAILAVTRSCAYRCAHCYEHFNLGAREVVPVDRWRGVIREIQDVGASVIVLSGGEPLARFEQSLDLLACVDKSRSDVHLFTTGHGLTAARIDSLVRAGLAGVGVGLDDYDPGRFDTFRGSSGAFHEAIAALRAFAAAGILTYANTCLTKELVRADGLWRLYELLRENGVGALQLLEPRPCGRLAAAELEAVFSEEDRASVRRFFDAVTRSRRFQAHPAVYYPAFMEAPENLGCMMGGLSHLHVDSLGNVNPCVFLPVSFGNVLDEGFQAIYARMRGAVPRPLHGRCPSLQLAEVVGFSREGGRELPVPYEAIREEWERLYQ